MDHDHSYKLLFSHAERVADLLRGFVHEDWVAQLDFASLERHSASYVADDLREREDDVIWRVRFGEGWLYVYLLIEFQSKVDRFMAVRILAYLGLLYQDLIRAGQLSEDRRLPPVLPIVLYNGKPRWTAPVDIADLLVPAPGMLGRYSPRLRYFLIDEGRFADSELEPLRNLAAALFRLENSRTPQDLEQVLAALVVWLEAPEQTSLRRAFTVWLKRVLLPSRMSGVEFTQLNELQEVRSMLAERVVEWTESWEQQGIQKGIAKGMEKGIQKGMELGIGQGIQQGEAALLLRLLERRFGSLDESVRQRLAGADADTLLEWGERIFDAQCLEDVWGL
jgi:predicted transposase/invertase (TIGR01784 family)